MSLIGQLPRGLLIDHTACPSINSHTNLVSGVTLAVSSIAFIMRSLRQSSHSSRAGLKGSGSCVAPLVAGGSELKSRNCTLPSLQFLCPLSCIHSWSRLAQSVISLGISYSTSSSGFRADVGSDAFSATGSGPPNLWQSRQTHPTSCGPGRGSSGRASMMARRTHVMGVPAYLWSQASWSLSIR